jgi:putative addiction module killer protein
VFSFQAQRTIWALASLLPKSSGMTRSLRNSRQDFTPQTFSSRSTFHGAAPDWLTQLADARAQAKIATRIDRLAAGNFGDCKPLRQGLSELRIDWGPGYRVYYAMIGRECVLLLCAGDKRKQSADIDRALEYLKDLKERTGTS